MDVARHGWMAPFALIFLSGGLALFWGAAGLAATLRSGLLARALLLVLAISLCEYARSNVLTGFPWGLLAYHWIETPLAQSLAFAGPHGLGLLSVLLGVATVIRFPWGAVASALVTTALWAGFALTTPPIQTPENPIIVRLIQPNAAQHLKWQPEHMQRFFDRQIELTQSDGPPRRCDLAGNRRSIPAGHAARSGGADQQCCWGSAGIGGAAQSNHKRANPMV